MIVHTNRTGTQQYVTALEVIIEHHNRVVQKKSNKKLQKKKLFFLYILYVYGITDEYCYDNMDTIFMISAVAT